MKIFRGGGYLQGYMRAFSLYPTGKNDNLWEDTRRAYEEVGSALWGAFLDEVDDWERHAQGVADEQKAREIGKLIKETCRRSGI